MTDLTDDDVRRIVREELGQTHSRREFLGALGAGGAAGLLAGAGSATAKTSGASVSASLGTVAPSVYQWADPGGLSGPGQSRSNATNYDTGRVHLASDERVWAYDTGSTWDVIGPAHEAALAGYIVGERNGETVVRDPADYSDAGAAMQAVVDTLQSGSGSATLRFSPFDRGGSELVIDQSVEILNSNGPLVVPQGVGFYGRTSGGYLRPGSSFDPGGGNAGQPLFRLRGYQAQGARIGGFSASGKGSDPSDYTLVRFEDINGAVLDLCEARYLGYGDGSSSQTKGGFVIDTGCDNNVISRCTVSGASDESDESDITDVDGFALVDDQSITGEGPPTRTQFMAVRTFASTSNGFRAGIAQEVGAEETVVGGGSQIEGAQAQADIYVTSGDIRTGACTLGRTNSGGHGLFSSGTYAIVGEPTASTSIDGTAVVLNVVGFGGYVGATRLDGNANAFPSVGAIEIGGDPQNAPLSLPDRNTVLGSVNYPSSTSNTYERDATNL